MRGWLQVAVLGVAPMMLACAFGLPPQLDRCDSGGLESALPLDDFVSRYSYRTTAPGVSSTLELVAEKHGDRLAVVGFNEFGVKAFSVTRLAGVTTVERHLGPLLRVPPENVVDDLFGARFLEEMPVGSVVVLEHPSCRYQARVKLLSRLP